MRRTGNPRRPGRVPWSMTQTVPPPAPALTEDEKTPAYVLHLSPLATFVLPSLGAVLGPLVAWLVFRDRSALLDAQGKEVLNFQLSFLLYGLLIGGVLLLLFGMGLIGGAALGGTAAGSVLMGGSLFAFFVFFLPFALLMGLVPLVFMVLAVLAVNAGRPYRYPLSIRFLR